MNLLGKIFVVLILLMSVVFMTMAMFVYGTHKNWREEIERKGVGPQAGYRARVEQMRAENKVLSDKIAALQAVVTAERAAKAEALAKAQTALSLLNTTYESAAKELAEKTTALASSTAAIKTSGENLTAATTQVQALTKDVMTWQTRSDNWFKQTLGLTDKLSAATVQLAELKPRLDQITEMVAKMRLYLATLGRTGEDAWLADGPPPLESTVAAITKENLVEIGVGFDDGIRKGHEMDIVRGSTFLGRIQIIDVRPDEAVGTVMKEYQTAQIKAGDTATSKLRILARRK